MLDLQLRKAIPIQLVGTYSHYMTRYRLASKCMENAEDARELREKATEISRLAFGPDSPHVAMQDRLFEEWCTKGL